MNKVLSSSITSYDLLKTFAVVTMILDHIGLYLFPDEMWFRTIGRLSFPVWLFLIGYARSRDISPKLMAGAGIVLLSNIVAGQGLFPLNILFSIMIVRACLDPLMARLQKPLVFWGVSALFLVLSLPSFIAFEFGFQAFIFAILGYLARHVTDRDRVFRYAVFAGIGYVFVQSFGFALFGPKLILLAAGMLGVMAMLLRFDPAKTYGDLPLKPVLQLCGRRTLEIYVVHLIALKALALILGVEGYGLFNWGWVW